MKNLLEDGKSPARMHTPADHVDAYIGQIFGLQFPPHRHGGRIGPLFVQFFAGSQKQLRFREFKLRQFSPNIFRRALAIL